MMQEWAFDEATQLLLADIAQNPHQDHGERVRAALPDGVAVGHVKSLVELVELVARRRWTGPWSATVRKEKGNVFHTLLFHLLGGQGSGLLDPSHAGVATSSKALRLDEFRLYLTFLHSK